jgi:membrane protein implicated in regulation of membrane protease activity
MYQPWFAWALTGVVCIGLEMLLPGFVIFFFGIGGLLTAALCFIPFVSDMVWLQLIVFVASSVLSLVFLRRRFKRIFAGTVFDPKKGDVEEDGIGEIADVIENVGSVNEGRIRFRGTSWKSFSRDGEFSAGSKVRIISRENMTYIVGPVEPAKEGEQ